MIFIYILLILIAAFPLLLTIWRMRRTSHIKKTGVHVNGTITHIRQVRVRAAYIDFLTIEYKDRNTGKLYNAKATTASGKFRYNDPMPLAYLPGNPAKYAITNTRGAYTFMLVFSILLFLFALFAVYKVDEMVRRGEMYRTITCNRY